MALSRLSPTPDSPDVWEAQPPGPVPAAPRLLVVPKERLTAPASTGEARPGEVVSDDELIAAMAAGEHAALGPLYDRHHRMVFTLLVRIVGDRDVAEELLQEVFLRAWQQARSFDETRGTVRAWLHCMAHSLALNELRRRRRRPQVQGCTVRDGEDESDPYTGFVDPAPDPAADACSAVRNSAVAAALGEIPPAQRQVLTLYAAGFSQSEIAARLGEPLGTIKSRMRRGLGHLREALTSAGVDAS